MKIKAKQIKGKTESNVNLILLLVAIFAFWVVIKQSEIPILPFVPKCLYVLFIQPKTSISREIFRILENLSLAIIASLVFYVIIDFLPNESRKKKSYLISKSDIKDLYQWMSELICSIEILNGDENINSSIKKKCFNKSLKISDKPIFFKRYHIVNDVENSYIVDDFFECRVDLVRYIKRLEGAINKIIQTPSFVYCDYNLIKAISSIKANKLLDIGASINIVAVGSQLNLDQNILLDFINLHNELKNYDFEHVDYRFQKMNDCEIKAYIAKMNFEYLSCSKSLKNSNKVVKILINKMRIKVPPFSLK